MAAVLDTALEVDLEGKHFAKRVPATSVSPTYKLTLPSEFVYGALSHLVDKDFQLVSAGREHAWSVAILPRKNKDKYEYTLQGWRAFAEEQSVKTGDKLEFSLLAADRLQIDIVRRAQLEAPYLHDLAEHNSGRGGSTSSNEEKQLSQVGGVHSHLGPATPHGETPFAKQASSWPQRGGLLINTDRNLNILELGHDPRDEALSPRNSTRAHKGPFANSPQVSLSRTHQGSANEHSFRPSTESEHLPFNDADEQLWLPHEMIAGALGAHQAKQDRIGTSVSAPNFGRSSGSLDAPVVTLPTRVSADAYRERQQPPGWTVNSQHSSQANDLRKRRRDMDAGEAGSVGDKQLHRELQAALMRESRAKQEFAAYLRAWQDVAGELDQQTARGLSLSRALLGVADRMGSADLQCLLEPAAARAVGLLRSDLRQCVDSLLDILWHVRNAYQEKAPGLQRREGQMSFPVQLQAGQAQHR